MKKENNDNYRGFFEGNSFNELNPEDLEGVAGGVDIISGKGDAVKGASLNKASGILFDQKSESYNESCNDESHGEKKVGIIV